MNEVLPPIPAKRYFTIGEVAELCGVKTHVLRYWEQEFTQLRPVKRRGNRRYYQHHEVLLVRRIRELLYEQRFTISGARDRLAEAIVRAGTERSWRADAQPRGSAPEWPSPAGGEEGAQDWGASAVSGGESSVPAVLDQVEQMRTGGVDLRRELMAIRRLLSD